MTPIIIIITTTTTTTTATRQYADLMIICYGRIKYLMKEVLQLNGYTAKRKISSSYPGLEFKSSSIHHHNIMKERLAELVHVQTR